uniref:Oxidation resistance protein 1 n=1 Tax=Salix viminalis TaxID=40686 RepID=A0A6N2LLB9_SALVM
MGKQQKSLRSKAVHFVSDLTTVILNPISDKPSKHPTPLPHPPPEDVSESKRSQLEFVAEEDTGHSVEEPDTSSFTAFLYSLLSSSESGNNPKLDEQNDHSAQMGDQLSENVAKVSGMKKGLFSTGKQTLRSIYQATRIGGYRSQESKGNSDLKNSDEIDDFGGLEAKSMLKRNMKEPVALGDLPGISEPSMLLSEKERSILYVSLPAVVQGRKWLLLYSTWRHGISLSSLYRRSTLWSGPSLLVVGDRKGAVFGGLVEAPLRPTNKKYQGTNSTFVFTNTPGHPVIFRPTGISLSDL